MKPYAIKMPSEKDEKKNRPTFGKKKGRGESRRQGIAAMLSKAKKGK